MCGGSCRVAEAAAAGCRLYKQRADLKHTKCGFIDTLIQTAGTCVTGRRASTVPDQSTFCETIDSARGRGLSAVFQDCGVMRNEMNRSESGAAGWKRAQRADTPPPLLG